MISRECIHLSSDWNLNMDGDKCTLHGTITTCIDCLDFYMNDKRTWGKSVTANSVKIEALEHLVKLQDDYIELLNKEISSLFGLAYVHGWKSSLVKEGEEARQKIAEIRKSLEEI